MIPTNYKLLWRLRIDPPRPSNYFTFRCLIEKVYYKVERTQRGTVIRYKPFNRMTITQNAIKQLMYCATKKEVALYDGDMLSDNIINPNRFIHNLRIYFTIKDWSVTPFLRTCDLIRFLKALPILLWKFNFGSYGNKHLRENFQTLSYAIRTIQKDSIEHERQLHSAILRKRE